MRSGAWKMGIQVAKISALVVPVAGIAMQVSFLVVLGVGGFRVASGAITVANLVTFILFLFMMILPLGQAFGAVTAVNAALGALGRIQEIVDLPAEDQFDRDLAPLAITVGAANEAMAPDAPAIAFVDVHFAYPDAAIAPHERAQKDADAEQRGRGATRPGAMPSRPWAESTSSPKPRPLRGSRSTSAMSTSCCRTAACSGG